LLLGRRKASGGLLILLSLNSYINLGSVKPISFFRWCNKVIPEASFDSYLEGAKNEGETNLVSFHFQKKKAHVQYVKKKSDKPNFIFYSLFKIDA